VTIDPNDLVAGAFWHRKRLARDDRFVDGTAVFDQFSVNRHSFALSNEYNIARSEIRNAKPPASFRRSRTSVRAQPVIS